MHIWRNRLIAGCVDKASFGKHGLLHILYVSPACCLAAAGCCWLLPGWLLAAAWLAAGCWVLLPNAPSQPAPAAHSAAWQLGTA